VDRQGRTAHPAVNRARRRRSTPHSASAHRFLSGCIDSQIPELLTLAATIDTWWPEINAFVQTDTNVRTEGYNRLVKQGQAKRLRVPQSRELGPTHTIPLHPQTAGRNPDFVLIARSKSKSHNAWLWRFLSRGGRTSPAEGRSRDGPDGVLASTVDVLHRRVSLIRDVTTCRTTLDHGTGMPGETVRANWQPHGSLTVTLQTHGCGSWRLVD
jgi:hypothetical protein